MDHDHGPESSISDEADPLYQPLGIAQWTAAAVDEAVYDRAVAALEQLRGDEPDWGAMVGRGAKLAAAYQSGALDGVHHSEPDVRRGLLLGELSLASLDATTAAHVRANYDALLVARDAEVSEEAIRGLHEVACRPQLTHRVRVDDRVQDHVLAGGDYKHHPNHVFSHGHWHVSAPVAQVGPEMGRIVDFASGPGFAALHPVAQAAFLQHALLHVQPFADGNGRVARALASGCLMRAASVPLVVPIAGTAPDPVELVLRAVVGLVDALATADRATSAVDRWRAEEAAARSLRGDLVPAISRALDRHASVDHRRADLSSTVVEDRAADRLVLRLPAVGVTEVLSIDAHPMDDGPPSVTARDAGLRLVAGDPLDPWLDRVVSTLALRVAAEID